MNPLRINPFGIRAQWGETVSAYLFALDSMKEVP